MVLLFSFQTTIDLLKFDNKNNPQCFLSRFLIFLHVFKMSMANEQSSTLAQSEWNLSSSHSTIFGNRFRRGHCYQWSPWQLVPPTLLVKTVQFQMWMERIESLTIQLYTLELPCLVLVLGYYVFHLLSSRLVDLGKREKCKIPWNISKPSYKI